MKYCSICLKPCVVVVDRRNNLVSRCCREEVLSRAELEEEIDISFGIRLAVDNCRRDTCTRT